MSDGSRSSAADCGGTGTRAMVSGRTCAGGARNRNAADEETAKHACPPCSHHANPAPIGIERFRTERVEIARSLTPDQCEGMLETGPIYFDWGPSRAWPRTA